MKKKEFIPIALAVCITAIPCQGSVTSLDVSSWLPAAKEDTSETGYQTYHAARGNHYVSSSPFTSKSVKFEGTIRVSDDDRSIESISPGGYLKISIRTFGNSRELLVNSNSRGELSYEFREGRKEVPFEPEGRKWLEDVLLDVVRSSGIDAEGRTARFYRRGGLDAVLDEISYIPGNSAMSMYFAALLENHPLSNRELSELAYAIVGKMTSSTEEGRLFRRYKDVFLEDPDVAASYFSAISKISSSSEKGRIFRDIDKPLDFSDAELTEAYFAAITRISSSTEAGSVLRHTIQNQDLPVRAQAALIRSSARISSNTETGRILRTLGTLDFSHPEIRESYFSTVDHLSSSTEAGSVLRDALRKNKLDGPAMVALLNSTRRISSSTEISSVIRTITEINLDDAAIREAYFNVIRTTSSSSESGRMLRHTLQTHELNQASLINLFETTKRVGSSTEISSVLRASVPHLIYESAVLDAFFSCTNSLSSSTEHGRVLRSLAVVDTLPRYAISGILLSTRQISSSSEQGSVLRAIAPKVKQGDRELRDLYMETAKSISSDSEYRRAVDAIM